MYMYKHACMHAYIDTYTHAHLCTCMPSIHVMSVLTLSAWVTSADALETMPSSICMCIHIYKYADAYANIGADIDNGYGY